MKKIVFIVLIIFILSLVSVRAGLGDYKIGELITYTVVCLTNEGAKDSGCGTPDDDILGPGNTSAYSPSTALAEVSDANFPGLWRGNFTIPSGASKGTWSIFIELTNSNSTTGATTLTFRVTDSSLNDLDNNFSTVISYVDSVESNQATLTSQINANVTTILSDTNAILIDTNEIQGNQSRFITATGFSTHSAANVWTVGTRTLTTADWTTDSDLSPLCYTTNLTSGIVALTSATETQIDNIETDTNEIQGNQSRFITATGFSTHNETDIWAYSDRVLTFYPTVTAVLTLDISLFGLINNSFYYVELAHIFSDIEPENEQSMKTYYYNKILFDIGIVPSNVTNGYVIYWLKKVGNPTGNLTLIVEGNNISTINVSTLSTSFTRYTTQFGKGNITEPHIEIKFQGQSAWTQANDVILGAGEVTGENSYQSSDDSTYIHPDFVFAVGLFIEYNQPSILSQISPGIADAIWDETVATHTTDGTYGKDIIANLSTIIDEVDDLEENITSIITDATWGLATIKTYLVDTIYDYLINTIQSYTQANFTTVFTRLSEINSSISGNATTIADAVWTWNKSGYSNPGGSVLNMNQTIKQIAENTEEGGY